jgi:hypothetical protein
MINRFGTKLPKSCNEKRIVCYINDAGKDEYSYAQK